MGEAEKPVSGAETPTDQPVTAEKPEQDNKEATKPKVAERPEAPAAATNAAPAPAAPAAPAPAPVQVVTPPTPAAPVPVAAAPAPAPAPVAPPASEKSKARNTKSKVITVTSGKGGVGKTTTTANLGIALAKMGKKVVLIDADIGLRNLDVVMGLENRIVYDLVDIIEGRAKLRQAMIKHKQFPDLCLIPAAQKRDKSAVSPADMISLCDQLREDFDFVLIDCPAGIERGFRNAIAPADLILIITNPEVSAVRDADRIIGLIEAEDKGPGQLILTRVKAEMIKKGDMLSPDDVIDILGIKIIGIVPEDEGVIPASNSGVPVALSDNSRAGQAYRNIARRLLGEDVPFLPLDGGGNFLQRLVRFIVGSDE